MKAEEMMYCVSCRRPSMECTCGEVCFHCGGSGTVITCIDDICHAQGYCMHGDGEGDCPECGGTGQTTPARKPYESITEKGDES